MVVCAKVMFVEGASPFRFRFTREGNELRR